MGRKISCRRFMSPAETSPPTKFGFQRSSAAGGENGSGENAIAEAGSETLNLTLHWLEAIGRASVRNVTIRPCGVVACGSTGGVEEGWLDEQDERSVGGELALRCDDLLERTSEVDGSSA